MQLMPIRAFDELHTILVMQHLFVGCQAKVVNASIGCEYWVHARPGINYILHWNEH